MYITSADLNSNGLMIYNDSAATANISANIQNVRVLSTGATLNNRGIVFNNNNTTKTIAGNVTNCNLTAYASTGVTDIALYVNSTTTFNVTVNAYNSLFSGADSDVTVISTNSCTLTNCTLVNGTVTGTVVYSGTQVGSKAVLSSTLTMGDNIIPAASKGMNFTGNTPAAGMTSQLFKWYEEGTVTVTLTPSTSGTITLTAINVLAYTRFGRVVHMNGLLEVGSVSLPVGTIVRIGGLPFTTGNNRSGGGFPFFATSAGTVQAGIAIVPSVTTADIIINAALIQTGSQTYVGFFYTI